MSPRAEAIRPIRQEHGRRERGASAVEFALVVPMLFLVLFGIMDFGLQFLNLNSIHNGTREGARQAVVANFGTTSSCNLVGVADTGSDGSRLICLTKDRIGLPAESVRAKVKFTTTNNVGRTMLVCAMHPMESATGMFDPLLNGKVIKSKVEMRIEQTSDTLQNTAETALPGQNWNWCV